MRAYFFGNMYLSSIQQGIQAGHVIGEIFTKYMGDNYDCYFLTQVVSWATDHKTMILLNGGYGKNLHDLYDMFLSESNPFPFAKFHEEQAALDGAITSVGIVLPEHIYIGASILKNNDVTDDAVVMINGGKVPYQDDEGKQQYIPISDWERDLMYEMNQYRLAN